MGSIQNKIKSFERHFGVHLKSLRRSRRFSTLFLFFTFTLILIFYKFMHTSKKTGHSAKLESCVKSRLEIYSDAIASMNTVHSEWSSYKKSLINNEENNHLIDNDNEKLFLPFTGNGYLGISINSNLGVYVYHQKAVSLPIKYNPVTQISSDILNFKEINVIEFLPGLVNRIKCFQINSDCITITHTVFAHRIRPSVLIEEISLNNPTKESVTFDLIQSGVTSWNQSKIKLENFNGMDFSITSGVIDIVVDSKLKHLCISVGSTRLPQIIRLKEHDLNSKYDSITVVKYSTTFLSGKVENLDPVLQDLENQVIQELREVTSMGANKLKNEHTKAWNSIWKHGFGISNSLAQGAINGDQINATIYYVLANNRAPFMEISKTAQPADKNVEQHMQRCYEGFSTLYASKLWRLPRNESDMSHLSSVWSLTLDRFGCKGLMEYGVTGVNQAMVLSLGGFKFTNHHLELNLNPRQIHRDYYFRKINYANMSFISVDVHVGEDNHAMLYVTVDELIDENRKFFACDAGCIDPPVELMINKRELFPVKLTNPLTSILYISSDKNHIDDLKHALHVQEVDIAPPQDVNSIAMHKHGHHLAGLATLFWTLFVILIIIFHLFLFKLVYREMRSSNNSSSSNSNSNSKSFYYDSFKKQRFARTV